jgi:site-specific recombinase XerD
LELRNPSTQIVKLFIDKSLPLLNDVGESIIDYLKNGRPQIDSQFIFLRHSAPYTELTAAALHPIMKKYRTLAKIPTEPPRKAGLHALRHSLATSLLEDATPLPTISEVLNHKKTETTRIYTRIDVSGLKKCALEVPVPLVIGGENE